MLGCVPCTFTCAHGWLCAFIPHVALTVAGVAIWTMDIYATVGKLQIPGICLQKSVCCDCVMGA